ncbi:MAG: AmmeMemoRadiSam system protein A [Bacteroidetes bacterium]|nr:MAG: AmmeMemoRadiSam system protein A [Bacteroidota bacterium]
MYTAQSTYTKTAFKAIKEFLKTGTTRFIENQEIPKELLIKAACFVTLKTDTNKLRGCIGTLNPVYRNLYTEIIKNAVASAVRDYRFTPLTLNELKKIKLSVEVLYPPEEIDDLSLLNPKIYGAIISDNAGNRGVLLPNIEGIDTVEEQIKIIKRKAGIFQTSNEGLIFHRFKTDKYY